MTRRTPEQQIAYHQDQIKRIKAAESRRRRNARTKRLCASAGKIEAVAGFELDEEIAEALGSFLAKDAQNPDSWVARHLAARAAAERALAEAEGAL